MSQKRGAVASLLILIAVALLATACIVVEGARVGDLQTESQTVELGDADAVNVEIQMGAGKLDVSGGASELLEASFTYNVEELQPQVTYSDGRMVVKSGDAKAGIKSLVNLDEFRSEWDLKLSEEVPMEMNINLGIGPSTLVLGDLALTRLNVEGGAGEVTIDLTGVWQNDLDARIGGGLGDINLRLPGNAGVSVEVETGIGGIDASGLTRDGDTYTNDAYGTSDVTLRIEIEGGAGHINLDVE